MDNLFTVILTAFGAFIGWFFTRRKTKAEAIGSEIDNDTKVVDLWRNWSAHLQDQIEEMEGKIAQLTQRIEELEEENKQHLKTIENLLLHGRGKHK
jgi:peptidoglycan hydrolase CwlO-like protein